MDVPVYNVKGAQVGSMTIDEAALGGEINPSLIKQAYVAYHAAQRQGSARSKNRHLVEGTTKKMYKQKGTGHARHGDRKVPQFKGGGHAHSKKRTREDYRLELPKKMRRKANRNALLAKLLDNEVRVLDAFTLSSPKTKDFTGVLEALKVDRSALVAAPVDGENIRKAGRNVAEGTVCRPDQLTCFEMLNHRYVVIGRPELEAWLTGPSSQTGKDAKVNPLGREGT